jgi:hypothetical protein
MNTIRVRHRAAGLAVALAAAAVLPVAGCGGSGAAPPTVPSLSQGQASSQGASGSRDASGSQGASGSKINNTGGGSGPARVSALHAAAQCIRQHGVPAYTDPVLTPTGSVYTDARSMQDAGQAVLDAVQHACGTLIATANFNPQLEPPAPPQLVQAGVRAAQCLRAHGLQNLSDPSARSPYTPGHGFGMTRDELPAGGKASPVWQNARQACVALVTAEIQASTLPSLSNDS